MLGFDKTIPSVISEYELYDVNSSKELDKVANTAIDLPEGFEFDPDYLYLWVRIISAGEYYGPNKNGDYFPESELLEYYHSFSSANVFKNHENKKVENAIGSIISVRWNPIMKCVEIFKGIDRQAAPEIVRGFLKGYINDVSMGCKVPYTICSVCGNKARKQNEFCDHVKSYRNQYFGNGERVFEINREPKFHDSSVVLNGAERVAKALVIIDKPPVGAATTFKKVANTNGMSRYIRLTDQELEKVAQQKIQLHPFLMGNEMDKLASDSDKNPTLSKIAELEKEVSGKLMNIVSAPEQYKKESAQQMLNIIKFLTEKRMDETTLESLATTLKSLAKEEGIPLHRAFSILIGVAELVGIEFFPNELHTLLTKITDATFKEELSLSESPYKEVFPSEYARGLKRTMAATEQLPEFKDPSSLFEMYNEGAHHVHDLNNDPFGFVGSLLSHDDLDEQPSTRVVKVIHQTLSPMMSVRSHLPAHLLPRLNTVLSGHHSILGNEDVGRDLNVLTSPSSLGDMLAAFAYKNYQKMRPQIKVTRLVKMALTSDTELEKTALFGNDYFSNMKENTAFESGRRTGKEEITKQLMDEKAYKRSKGIGRIPLALAAVPAFYGMSAFQENRRENGRNLTDVENFMADRPGILSAGVVLAGKPLSRQVALGIEKGKKVIKQADEFTGMFEKTASSLEFAELVKIADAYEAGQMNAFDETFMKKFAGISGLSGEEAVALKVASLFDVSGMEKEAGEIRDYYNFPAHATGQFLKEATVYAREEFEKAAGEFTNAFLLDSIVDQRNMTNSLPGRVVDAFVFKKLGDMAGGPEAKKKKKEDGPDLPESISASKGPAPYQHMKGDAKNESL